MVTKADFESFDRRNPQVWEAFERYALEAAKHGKRVGAKAIWERMRWYARVECEGDDFAKLNNTWTSWYVRKFQREHPGYGMIFETRQAAADKEKPGRDPPYITDRHGQGIMPGFV